MILDFYLVTAVLLSAVIAGFLQMSGLPIILSLSFSVCDTMTPNIDRNEFKPLNL